MGGWGGGERTIRASVGAYVGRGAEPFRLCLLHIEPHGLSAQLYDCNFVILEVENIWGSVAIVFDLIEGSL